MTKAYHFEVVAHPIGKQRPRRGKGGQFYTPPKTKQYENFIRIQFLNLYRKDVDAEHDWSLCVDAYVKGRAPDGDNILKAVADALTGYVWANDRQVKDWRITMHKADDKEYIVINARVRPA